MRIYNWIDSFFDTKEKRKNMIFTILSVYWIWQNIWQSILYYQVLKIQDYSSLFTFASDLKAYDSSLFVRILYVVIMQYSKGLWSILFLFIRQFSIVDFIMILLTIVLFITEKSKKKWRFIGVYLAIAIWNLILVYLGYQQGSLMGVVSILKWLAIGSLGLELVLIGSLLWFLIKRIEIAIATRNVHVL